AKVGVKPENKENCIGRMNEGCIVGKSRISKTMYCLPYGVQSVPPDNQNLLVTTADEKDICCGVLCHPNVAPGEIYLCSAGGATIRLCNDGRVLINGKAYSAAP
ncbi:MAG: hypothetical protein RR263_04115, partial [Oscillospiraceae bacterium]